MSDSKKVFSYPITVSPVHIDILNHVNNEVYIKWLMEAAIANSAAVGYTMEKYLSDAACFVVRRHEVDYLSPAFLNEELVVETWIEDMKSKTTTRVYKIKRLADQKILITAKTLWVYANINTGKPAEIPQALIESFKPYIHS